MEDLMLCNRLRELWLLIDQLHLNYLHTDESLHKLDQRNKLENYIREYLCLVPHNQKFCFRETAEVLHRSASSKDDFSGYRAACAWNAVGTYASNLLAQPWRKEYRELKMFCGFYKHEVEANLVGAEVMLEAMGYKHTGHNSMVLEGPIDLDSISNVSRDSLMAFVECQLLKTIWEEVSCRFDCGWLEVLEFRENHVGTPDHAIRGLVYHFHQRQYREQQLATYQQNSTLDMYGTARYPNCMYNQVQPLHHMGYYNYSPYSYTLPPQARYPQYPLHPPYHHLPPPAQAPVLPPSNGHYTLPHGIAPVQVVMQNGYGVPTQPTTLQSFNCPVPTGKLIELDVAAPPQSSSSEAQHTDSSSSVLIPRTVRHHNRQQQEHTPVSDDVQQWSQRSDSQQPPSSKAKEDGTGTFESWDYVYRNLENQGYNKDLGERPDILSPSPERKPLEESKKERPQPSSSLDLEETLMEMRLEEFNRKAMPSSADHRPLKINEALQKIRMESDELSRLAAGKTSGDMVDSSTSVYDNMSSPPKDNPVRERPVTITTTPIKPTCNNSHVVGKATTKTLPRDSRRSAPENDRNFVSTTLDPRKLRDCINNYSPSEPEPVAVKRTSADKNRVEEKSEKRNEVQKPSPREVEIAQGEKWECVTCTFLNSGSNDICEMCGKSKVRGPESRPLASGGRECPQCTLVNEKGVGTCEACGTSLKDSPTYI